MVRDTLVLDHFYIGVEPDIFARLLPLEKVLTSCTHTQVKSGQESWEGIYLRSRTGAYFEILNDRKLEGFGIAVSPVRTHATDALRIVQEMPELPWKTGLRVTEDGRPWFDWITLGDYSNIHEEILNTWIMNYHRAHNDQAKGPTICTIDRFASIEFKVGKDHFEYIKSQTNWLSGVQLYSEALVLLEIPDREGSVFQVRFELMPGKSRFEFVRLLGDVSRNCGVSSLNLGPFEFESDGSNFVLNYRK